VSLLFVSNWPVVVLGQGVGSDAGYLCHLTCMDSFKCVGIKPTPMTMRDQDCTSARERGIEINYCAVCSQTLSH
jgi:hypothetical protein